MDIQSQKAQVRTLAAAVEAGTATDEQVTELAGLVETIEKRDAAATLAARAITAAAEVVEAPAAATPATVGEQVVRSAQFSTFTGKGTSQVVEYASRAVTTGDLVINPTIVAAPIAPVLTPLTGLVNVAMVDSDAISITTETVTYSADVVAEGDVKPASDLTYSVTPATVETIAHYIKVSRQALESASFVESTINNRLLVGLSKKVEANIASAILDSAADSVEGATLVAAIRGAQAEIEADGYVPTVVLLNPADAAAIDLSLLGSTLNGAVSADAIWGLRKVVSPAVTAGTAIVGDINTAVTLFDRGVSAVYKTDADGTDFQKNIVTILAETRVKAAVVAPAALRKAVVAA